MTEHVDMPSYRALREYARTSCQVCTRQLVSARCVTARGGAVAAFPALLLGLLPKRVNRHMLRSGVPSKVKAVVEAVERSEDAGDLIEHVLRDHAGWIAAVQRAQAYSLRLTAPLRALECAIASGKLKIAALTSREFATLASVCSRSRTPEGMAILGRLCDQDVIQSMLHELENSDYALFLTSAAQSSVIDRLDSEALMAETLRRLPSMSTFDIAVTCDALGRLRRGERDGGVMAPALRRFAAVMDEDAPSGALRSYRAPVQLSRVSERHLENRSAAAASRKGPGAPASKAADAALATQVALLLRASVRADAVNRDDVRDVAIIAARVGEYYAGGCLRGAPFNERRDISDATTTLMCLCCVLAKIGQQSTQRSVIDCTVEHILRYIWRNVEPTSVPIKERTKLCMAIQMYWHLVPGRGCPDMLPLRIYDTIVCTQDEGFLNALAGGRESPAARHTEGDNITSEVGRCLAGIGVSTGRSIQLARAFAPPYAITVLSERPSSC